MRWQVQEAKQRFSEVLRAVEMGQPQIVTKHGEEIAVIIDIEEYHRLRGDSSGLMAYLRAEPPLDDDDEALTIDRSREPVRDVDLVG